MNELQRNYIKKLGDNISDAEFSRLEESEESAEDGILTEKELKEFYLLSTTTPTIEFQYGENVHSLFARTMRVLEKFGWSKESIDELIMNAKQGDYDEAYDFLSKKVRIV